MIRINLIRTRYLLSDAGLLGSNGFTKLCATADTGELGDHARVARESCALAGQCDIRLSPVAQSLIQELLLLMFRGERQSEAVLAYLAAAEAHEEDVWLRDDIRLSWLTVLRAAAGHSDPWRYSFWTMFGKVPEKVIPIWCERAQEHAEMENSHAYGSGFRPQAISRSIRPGRQGIDSPVSGTLGRDHQEDRSRGRDNRHQGDRDHAGRAGTTSAKDSLTKLGRRADLPAEQDAGASARAVQAPAIPPRKKAA